MSSYTDVRAFLQTISALTDSITDRVYSVNIPQGAAFPCVRIEIDEDGGFKDFDGQGETIRSDIRMDFIADTLDVAGQMAAAVTASLKNHQGAMGSRYVHRASLENVFDAREDKLAGGKYRVSQAWTVWHH